MQKDVKAFVDPRVVCQQTKFSIQASTGLLQPLPIPSKVCDDLTMDFIVRLPLSRGNSVIMVVVDHLTKYTHFGALPPNFIAKKVANFFVDIVVKLCGYLSLIVKNSTSYHPQMDGQTKVVNRGLEQYLRVFFFQPNQLVGSIF